jgi:hypothetical protein
VKDIYVVSQKWLEIVVKRPFVIILFYAFDHGLRTPNEAFFYQIPKLLGLGRQIGQINFGAFGVFSANLSAPGLVL